MKRSKSTETHIGAATSKASPHSSPISPARIFLLDAAGALASAMLLFFVLRRFNHYLGLPQATLAWLALPAAAFCIYSFLCSIFLRSKWRPFLILIIVANIFYCCLLLALLIRHASTVTKLGVAYFLGEIFIIGLLVTFELKQVLRAN